VAVRKGTGAKTPVKTEPGSSQESRKKNSSSVKGRKPYSWAVLFWLAFVIFIVGFFIFNREAISKGFETIGTNW